MALYNREQVADRALASTSNEPGGCYKWSRTIVGSTSVGDVDRDGDADAVDGWKAARVRHLNDRTPPRGVVVFWSGGSHGYGHAAISLGGGKIRSTDAAGSGKPATVDLDWPERHWGLRYLGWSEDLNGVMIPLPPAPAKTPVAPAKPAAKSTRVTQARALLRAAIAAATRKGNKRRADSIGNMLDDGPKR